MATKTASRPSEIIGIDDEWLAYQFDNAVVLVGTAIENAAQEMEKYGSDDKPQWRQKYTMKQLLDPDFRLPVEDSKKSRDTNEDDFFGGLSGFGFEEIG